ncbi:hypothetical protein PV08_00421 [Exophiala spinifera]|uniref:Uncharacterized protein n=1 Tax=Exophiala spinifera TaxID=91928 RepID=A0A0D1YX17_9EURO|nr:uncharacterized protein PV08_00421 [Exophiala spinifera]KIW19846.1 hypothetical protein PV08_00421 [Exophiala spinifera]
MPFGDVVLKTLGVSPRQANTNDIGSHRPRNTQRRDRIPEPRDAPYRPQASGLRPRHKPGGYTSTYTGSGGSDQVAARSQINGNCARVVSVELNVRKTANEGQADAQHEQLLKMSPARMDPGARSSNNLELDEQRSSEDFGSMLIRVADKQSTTSSPRSQREKDLNIRLSNKLANKGYQLEIEKSKYDKTYQKLRAAQLELARSQETILALNRSLEDCKERIFAIQPAQGMSDNQILDLYESMYEDIEEWADLYCGDVNNTIVSMAMAQMDDQENTWVWKLFSYEELECTNDNMSIDKSMLASFVFRILHDKVLKESCPMVRLDAASKSTLKSLSDSIARLQPAKDRESCQMWKMDMHRALRASERLKDVESAGVKQVTRLILECLEFVVPAAHQDVEMEDELHKIVSMAADLAKNIRINMAEYAFDFPLDAECGAEERVMMADDMKNYSIIDSNTGFPLRASSKVIADQGGRVGEKLSLIFPGLVRRDTQQDKRIELCKPVIVVKFDHTIPRGGKPKAFV